MSIIDLSPAGRQPMSDEQGDVWTVFNGEIYNFREIRDELRDLGHRFAGDSDTEVIPHAYKAWGVDCFARFDGMFAIAIWDTRTRRLILARDPHGKKPLFYHHAPGARVVFGSTLNAVLGWPDVPRRLDHRAAYGYLRRGYVHAPRSIAADVAKIPPGRALEFQAEADPRSTTFWDTIEVAARPRLTFADETEYLNELERLLNAAVKKRLVSDVPLGIFLSGGVDSSLIAALAARVADRALDTFSIGFDSKRFDESEYARRVASHLGLRNTRYTMSGASLRDLVPDIVKLYDEPNIDFSLFPTMSLAKLARDRDGRALRRRR
ncbi:MAG: asparagine synthase (glutamine-hydrolyzing) [Pirellulales bacterium]